MRHSPHNKKSSFLGMRNIIPSTVECAYTLLCWPSQHHHILFHRTEGGGVHLMYLPTHDKSMKCFRRLISLYGYFQLLAPQGKCLANILKLEENREAGMFGISYLCTFLNSPFIGDSPQDISAQAC